MSTRRSSAPIAIHTGLPASVPAAPCKSAALTAERSPVVLHRPAGGADAWAYPRAVAAALGWPADRLRIAPE